MRYTKSGWIVALVSLLIIVPFLVNATDISYTSKSPEALKFLMEGIEKSDGIQVQEARDLLQKALAVDPECAIAYYYLAGTTTTNEEYAKTLRKAVELAPKASEPERVMIQAAQAGLDGNADRVHRLLVRLVELVPTSPRAHVLLGYNLRGRQELAASEKEYRKAIELDPTHAPAFNALAYTLADLGRYPEAIDMLKKYSALRPKDPNPHDSMAEIYLWMGDHPNSIAEYNASLTLDPKFSGSIFGLGHNYVLMGQFDNARAAYDSWLKQAKDYGDSSAVYGWRALSYIHEGKPSEAVKTWQDEDAFGKGHNDVAIQLDGHNNLARWYRETGDYDKALAEIQTVRDLAKDPGITKGVRDFYLRSAVAGEAIACAYKGESVDAQAKMTELEKLAESDKSRDMTYALNYVRGEIALGKNDCTAALATFDKADPFSVHVKYHMAKCYEKQGKTKDAGKIYGWISKWNRNSFDLAMTRPDALKKT